MKRLQFAFLFCLLTFANLRLPGTSFAALLEKQNIKNHPFNKKSAILILDEKKFRVLKGTIIAADSDGVVFDQNRLGPFYNPPRQYFPLSRIARLIDANGNVLYDKNTSSIENLLHSRYFKLAIEMKTPRYTRPANKYILILDYGRAREIRGRTYSSFLLSNYQTFEKGETFVGIGLKNNVEEGYG